MNPMLKTPLNAWHHQHGGRMVDFAGWDMPVQYTSIVDEHNAVRSAVGLFDISHMGRIEFRGDAAGRFLNRLLTNDTAKLKVGDIRYSLMCRDDGGILDDVLVYRLPDRWLLVVNASNRTKIIDWLQQADGFAASECHDLTVETAMIAVQGPNAVSLVNGVLDRDFGGMKYYTGQDVSAFGGSLLVSRTGYTGEDGLELSLPAAAAEDVWERLVRDGASHGLQPAGLGCRDTLRLEAAMPLYGHELSESIDPLTAGLSFAVKLGKDDFVGKQALQAARDAGPQRRRIGLELTGRRIAREGAVIRTTEGAAAGEVTSGTFSPTLQKPIAMGYVESGFSEPGTVLQIDIRGTLHPATVVALPFYKRHS